MYKHINLQYLDLMTDGDKEMKATMIGMLLDEIPSEIKSMKESYNRQDWDAIHKIAHKMKSTLGYVGNEKMTRTNINIESKSKNQEKLDTIIQLIDTLDQEYENVAVELQKENQSINI